jgi:hypothetical protein
MTDNMATVLENEIVAVFGRLPQMQAVNTALQHTLEV